MSADLTVANAILDQLGGNRFRAMTGAKNFVGSSKTITFAIGRGAKNGINRVCVTLDASDTYTISFFRVRGLNVRTVSQFSDVYAEDLQRFFTAETGFDTTL